LSLLARVKRDGERAEGDGDNSQEINIDYLSLDMCPPFGLMKIDIFGRHKHT
jgi:hypothetical protein